MTNPFEFAPGDKVKIIGGTGKVAVVVREDGTWVSSRKKNYKIRFEDGNEMTVDNDTILKATHPLHQEIDKIKARAKKLGYIGILLVKGSDHRIYKKSIRSLEEEFKTREDCKANSTDDYKYEVFGYLQI